MHPVERTPDVVTVPGDGPAVARGARRGRWVGAGIGVVLVLAVALAPTVGGVAGPGSAEPATALGPPRFVEEAAAAGLDHAYEGDYPYVVGGGVATFDCDDDGRPDLYLAGGADPAALFRNVSPIGGALRFVRVADPLTDLDAVTGAYPLDIDGDRHTDLVVLRLGENVILRGTGDCRFERADAALDIDGGDGLTTAFSATFEGAQATLPTLAFGDYVVLDDRGMATDTCGDGQLFRPIRGATRYAAPIALRPTWCTLSMLFSDWDRSGRRDLRVSNDRHYYRDGEEQLWRIAPGEAPRLYTRDDGWERLQLWGMGIASRDLTGDGRPEVFLTSQGDNKLQALTEGASGPTYRDMALRSGATAHRPYAGGDILPSTAWHPQFADVNDDGYVDLFITKGNVDAETEHAMKDPSNLLIGQADGTFVEGAEAAGLVDFWKSRGAALVDLNLDGMLDLVKVVRQRPVELYRNVGSGDATSPAAMGHWLGIVLDADDANHDAIGAWVAVRVGDRITEQEVTVGGGHVSGQLGPVHVGLGAHDRTEVRVTWPDGEVGPWLPVDADRYVRVERGTAVAEPWTPPALNGGGG